MKITVLIVSALLATSLSWAGWASLKDYWLN